MSTATAPSSIKDQLSSERFSRPEAEPPAPPSPPQRPETIKRSLAWPTPYGKTGWNTTLPARRKRIGIARRRNSRH